MLRGQMMLSSSATRIGLLPMGQYMKQTMRKYSVSVVVMNKDLSKEKLHLRQIEFENRLRMLDEQAKPTNSTEEPAKTFEEKLEFYGKNTPRTRKENMPRWLRSPKKRFPTPYSLYVAKNWDTMTQEYTKNMEHYKELYPKLGSSLVTAKLLSFKWNNELTDEQKQEYYRIVAKMKEEQAPTVVVDERPEWKKIKRPRTAFLHFKMDIFPTLKAQFPSYNIQQINLVISEMYKKLPEDRLKHYKDMSIKERTEYYRKKEEILGPVSQPEFAEKKAGKEEEEVDDDDDDEEYDDFY